MNIVTAPRLNSALASVIRELDAFGFYDDALEAVDCYLVPFGYAYGWQYYGSTGHIHIPAFSLSRLSRFLHGSYASLRDVLRHEYGHALADTHRGIFRSRRFSDAFGAPHHWNFEWEYDPEHHVSAYAATAPAEDFAEVFMCYLRHQGRLPAHFSTPAIRRKWRFISELRRAVRLSIKRW